jgi:hypothetical protein
VICGLSTASGRYELELEFAGNPDAGGISYRAHPECFSRFADELERLAQEQKRA